ncbi:transcriptional regulator [Metarhizobium album]|uniref:Transcriptional regulator n=1 Tax=Metarhizobium album TaxID=2182425 RepID=A0A2U2DFG4_9HYPH|nr:ParB N-terminal domain-containing protein [Rhizobium album]PWE52055.1 transcriptional regulator [Rhizobium album]
MAEYLRIPLSKIHIGDRERPIDEDCAQAIAASMAECGLINPITVRRTPAANNGATPFTLVAGGHRLRGGVINEWSEIDAIVVEADAVEGQLIELQENLYRNELTKLDRALFVLKFREVWTDKYGKVQRGGDRKSKDHRDPLIATSGRQLAESVQERLGLGPASYKRVNRIGQNIRPELRAVLRGTSAADDQTRLLALSRLTVEEQLGIAAAMREGADLKRALSFAKPEKPQVDPQAEIYRKVVALLTKADDATQLRILHHLGELRDFSFLEDAA